MLKLDVLEKGIDYKPQAKYWWYIPDGFFSRFIYIEGASATNSAAIEKELSRTFTCNKFKSLQFLFMGMLAMPKKSNSAR